MSLPSLLPSRDVAALSPTVNTVAATGATEAISFDSEVHDLAMNENCTFSFSGFPASGSAGSITVIVRGAFTPTWPAAVVWPDGTEPDYGSPTVYTFFTVDGGTTVFGATMGKAFA